VMTMRISLQITKSATENSSLYFEKAKKAKKKLDGANKALERMKQNATIQLVEHSEKQKNPILLRKKEWFEKFRWFSSSDGFLVIGGKDAATNEIIIKKNTRSTDLVFHTDAAGSPFVVVKNPEGVTVPESTINEAAEFCASFSRQWKRGVMAAEVYYIQPDQVKKESLPGEYLQKGSFMIYGKRNYLTPNLNLGIGIVKDRIMIGPLKALANQSQMYFELIPGNAKASEIAKNIGKALHAPVDAILPLLPPMTEIKRKIETKKEK
jgi:predicted ribosome quality control (RQC) complex YloA/Tae2 family protein